MTTTIIHQPCEPSPKRRGFTLVELVIVVVIVGIIAAIAVTRMSSVAQAAPSAALRGSLASMRSAIDLFALEHEGRLPGADGLSLTFWRQLREKTDIDGNIGTTPGVHIYGPYLRHKVPVPVGPNPGAYMVRMTTLTPVSLAISEGQTGKGWVFNYVTGKLIANTDDLDRKGVGFDTY